MQPAALNEKELDESVQVLKWRDRKVIQQDQERRNSS